MPYRKALCFPEPSQFHYAKDRVVPVQAVARISDILQCWIIGLDTWSMQLTDIMQRWQMMIESK